MTNFPDKIFGIDTKAAYDRIMNAPDIKPEEEKLEDKLETEEKTGVDKNISPHLSEYIHLPSHNIFVAKEVTLKEKNWYTSHEAAQDLNGRMLTLREFIDFLLLLKSGDAKDGEGNPISKSVLTHMYRKIVDTHEPYRGEWLDARFTKSRGDLIINYNHKKLITGRLRSLLPTKLERTLEHLRSNSLVDLNQFNKQGLPEKAGSDFFYSSPKEGLVASFSCSSVFAGLDCRKDPEGLAIYVGVRLVYDNIGVSK